MVIQVNFFTPQTGIGYQFYAVDGSLLGTRITAGITALPQSGSYAADATVPPTAVGVLWTSDTSTASEDLRDSLAIASAASTGLTPGAIAKIEASAQILALEIHTPTPAPQIIIPAPTNPDLSTVYCYTSDITGVAHAGVKASFTLATPRSKNPKVLETSAGVATSDSTGLISIDLVRDQKYIVRCPALGLSHRFTLDTATFDLAALISC